MVYFRMSEGSGPEAYNEAPLIAGYEYPAVAGAGGSAGLTGPTYWSEPGHGNLCSSIRFEGWKNVFSAQPGLSVSANWYSTPSFVPTPISLTNAWTACAWVKVTPENRNRVIIESRYNFSGGSGCSFKRGWGLYLRPDGTAAAYVYTAAYPNYPKVLGTVSVDDGAWHHVAVIWEAGVLRLYIDGVVDTTAAATGTACVQGYATHTIGYPIDQAGVPAFSMYVDSFIGEMLDVRSGTHAITEAELADIVNIPFEHDLQTYTQWLLNDPLGSTMLRATGYGNELEAGNRLVVPNANFVLGNTPGPVPGSGYIQCLGGTGYDACYAYRGWDPSHSISYRLWFRASSKCGRKLMGLEQALTGSSLDIGESNILPLYFGTDGKVHLYFKQDDGIAGSYFNEASGVLALNTWHSVAVTLERGPDSTTDAIIGPCKLYVNGRLVGEDTATIIAVQAYWVGWVPKYWRVGGGSLALTSPGAASSGAFLGDVSMVETFCYVLSAEEINPPKPISSIMFSCNT